MIHPFTAAHRGGHGPPLVCLHGVTDTWRSWQLVLPRLQARHDVLAPTLPGHTGGAPLSAPPTLPGMVDAVAATMDDAGMPRAHLVGNSLGGWLALALAARGRALSVVALAPAGGWEPGDGVREAALEAQRGMRRGLRAAAPHVDALVATPAGRARATAAIARAGAAIPADLVAHLVVGAARCPAAEDMEAAAAEADWSLDPAAITCPLRIVWGTGDVLLPWPAAAAAHRRRFPDADWVELDDVGHCPQLDAPLVTAELILGVTRG